MAYVQYDNERESFEMFRVSDDAKIFAPQYRAAIENAREALGNFMECAWEYSDELADEGLLVTRFDEIASTIAKVTLLPLYLVGECLTVIVGVEQPKIDEYEDDIHDNLVRYFLED
jgi:hypothetical protein